MYFWITNLVELRIILDVRSLYLQFGSIHLITHNDLFDFLVQNSKFPFSAMSESFLFRSFLLIKYFPLCKSDPLLKVEYDAWVVSTLTGSSLTSPVSNNKGSTRGLPEAGWLRPSPLSLLTHSHFEKLAISVLRNWHWLVQNHNNLRSSNCHEIYHANHSCFHQTLLRSSHRRILL